MCDVASGTWTRVVLRALAALVGLVAIVGCSPDESGDESEGVTQEEYLASARAFEEERAGYVDVIVACAAAQGVDAEVTWDYGFVLPEGLDDQEVAAYWEAVHGCAEQTYPPEREPSADEIAEHYALLLAARQCLEKEGFATSEPAGFDDFLSAYRSGGERLPWSPYDRLAQGAGSFRDALEVCPQPGRF